MPISTDRAEATAAMMDIAADIGRQGSPFTIPTRPGQPRVRLDEAIEPGDLRGFLIALGLVCGLIALFGFSVLPRY